MLAFSFHRSGSRSSTFNDDGLPAEVRLLVGVSAADGRLENLIRREKANKVTLRGGVHTMRFRRWEMDDDGLDLDLDRPWCGSAWTDCRETRIGRWLVGTVPCSTVLTVHGPLIHGSSAAITIAVAVAVAVPTTSEVGISLSEDLARHLPTWVSSSAGGEDVSGVSHHGTEAGDR